VAGAWSWKHSPASHTPDAVGRDGGKNPLTCDWEGGKRGKLGAGCLSLRRCFATHAPKDACAMRPLQEQVGHNGVTTRKVYARLLNHGGKGVPSPVHSVSIGLETSGAYADRYDTLSQGRALGPRARKEAVIAGSTGGKACVSYGKNRLPESVILDDVGGT